MKELLFKLEALLINSNSDLIRNMNPGIAPKTIVQKTGHFNIDLPEEIINLYEWRNGTIDIAGQITGSRHFFRGAILMSIDKAIETHNIFISQEFPFYLSSYFTLFESLGEEFFVIDCDPGSSTFNMILSYAIKGVYLTDGAVPVFDTPSKMIETIIRCYQKNIYYVDSSSNQFVSNFSLEKGIIIEMNPRANKIRRSMNL